MISELDKNTVVTILGKVVGSYTNLSKNEYAFYCPFCHHHKQKLQVNPITQKWHCWVCDSGGSRISSLLYALDVDKKTIEVVKGIYKDFKYAKRKDDDTKIFISLPSEYKPLSVKPKGFNPEYLHAIHYLSSRGIGMKEIIKYNIGYCTEGRYARRLIIPSYWEDGSLNYFVSRSYYDGETMKYKNPPISKNVIGFDNQINWNEPIILCEGVFDAIAIRRNAIPLLGKFPSRNLIEKLFAKKIPSITLSLDNDARKEALRIADYFRKQGFVIKLMKASDKDASLMGYDKFYEELSKTKLYSEEDSLLSKINSI